MTQGTQLDKGLNFNPKGNKQGWELGELLLTIET
jgi:hypothetical protein